jgi:hypothetical protein
MRIYTLLYFGAIGVLCSQQVAAQEKNVQELITKDTTKTPFLKKITLTGVFQARYTISFTPDVDVKGNYHPDSQEEVVRNSFGIRRARLQVKAQISDRFTAVTLVNLAEFNNDPKGKVLENAFISYRWNDKLNFTVGQFRPAFGLEDLYPVDIIKSLDFSNQYYYFGKNGWQSFQIGVSMFGVFKDAAIPFSYNVAVVNGNNRNQETDNDNGKLASARLEFGKRETFAVGVNGGYGNVKRKGVYAAGIDVSGVIKLVDKWDLEIQTEYKRGTNHTFYNELPDSLRKDPMSKYQMGGIYVLPNLRYNINYRKLSSIEFSARYEYFNEDTNNNGYVRQTWMPMVSLAFLKDYGGRIQVGMQIDNYDRNVPKNRAKNNDLFIVQVQCRL